MTMDEKLASITEISAWGQDDLDIKYVICMTVYATLRVKPYRLHEDFYVK